MSPEFKTALRRHIFESTIATLILAGLCSRAGVRTDLIIGIIGIIVCVIFVVGYSEVWPAYKFDQQLDKLNRQAAGAYPEVNPGNPSTPGFTSARPPPRNFSDKVSKTFNLFELRDKSEKNMTEESLHYSTLEPQTPPGNTIEPFKMEATKVTETISNPRSTSTSQVDIPQLQKDNMEKFNAAVNHLLEQYIPAPLLEPHPNIAKSTPKSQDTNTIPSILEMEIRHAISHAARNVYHAHIQDDKKRAAFDFKYSELQDKFFGKGKKIANEMKKLAKERNTYGSESRYDYGRSESIETAVDLGGPVGGGHAHGLNVGKRFKSEGGNGLGSGGLDGNGFRSMSGNGVVVGNRNAHGN